MSQMNSELVPLTLTIKVKLAFKLQQFLKKKIEPFFNTPSNLKCELIIYGTGFQQGGRVGGEETPVLCECKKRPSLVRYCTQYPWVWVIKFVQMVVPPRLGYV